MGPSTPCTQLQFNRSAPPLPSNLAARFSGPPAIVIEKLKPPEEPEEPGEPALRGFASVPFSVISKEKLSLAVLLAKRDVRRKQLEELAGTRLPRRPPPAAPKARLRSRGSSEPTDPRADGSEPKTQGLVPGRQPETGPRAKVHLSLSPERTLRPLSKSPPTQDPGPQAGARSSDSQSMLELRRLQKELSSCIQRIEGVVARERPEEGLDPDEAARSQIRRQEQAVRTARMLYGLQQQVKEIQEELDKLSPHKIRHTKKSRALSRLAAARRGAIRALQTFVNQFTDSKELTVSEHCRELGSLIRQLSICSAKLDTDPSVPDMVLGLLQQIEELDSLLERKQPFGKIKKCFPGTQSQFSSDFPMALERSLSTSPVRERKPPVAKEKLPHRGRQPVVRKLLEEEHPASAMFPLHQTLGDRLEGQPEEDLAMYNQNVALKVGPASTRVKAMKKRPLTAPASLRRRGLGTAAKVQQGLSKSERPRPPQVQSKDCRLQRTTVSFRLKRNQPPIKDQRAPWIPPNPTSPPASPKCVAWAKVRASPRDAQREPYLPQEASPEEKTRRDPSVEREALRLAWLDAESSRRIKELGELKAQEMSKLQKMNSSTSKLADKVERAVLDRLKPLLDRVEEVNSSLEANIHFGDHSWGHEGAAQALGKGLPSKEFSDLQRGARPQTSESGARPHISQSGAGSFLDEDSPKLRTMMQRMEEMEQYQEAVRQRFSQMVYADLDLGTKKETSYRKDPTVNERPQAPHPIQLTHRAAGRELEAHILLEKPLDEKYFDESLDMEERGDKRASLRPLSSAVPQQPEGSILLSVPRDMLRTIDGYRDDYEQYLRTISHESIGTFNPWIIVESLAEELVEEALEDVAAELQDVCEDYAEAVFTSEFLEPSK